MSSLLSTPIIKSIGIAAIKSIINCPFRYFKAIVLESLISSPVIKFEIVVLKLKMMSIMNKTSINSLKIMNFLCLNEIGSNATSRGVVKQTHKPKVMIIKSQYIRNLELKGMTLVR